MSSQESKELSGSAVAQTMKYSASQAPEILTAVFKLSDYLNQLWNLFAVFSGLVVGWIISAKDAWSVPQKVIVAAIYLVFIAVNLSTMLKMYAWLNTAFKDLHGIAPRLDDETKHINAALKNISIPGGRFLPYAVYGIAVAAVLSSIFWLK